ncbi:hypothetical protein C0J50_10587, partial [Silurus asotus]
STSMQKRLIAEKHVSEGDDVILPCNFTTTLGDYVQWYRQFPESRPVFLNSNYISAAEKQPGNFDKKPEDLKISSAAVSGSAVYYCTLKPTVTGNLATLYKNLIPGKGSA